MILALIALEQQLRRMYLVNQDFDIRPSASIEIRSSRPREYGTKLSLEDVITLIEANGGPEGLDLSGRDLSGLDFSREAIQSHIVSRQMETSFRHLPWVTYYNRGFNLKGVNLVKANLFAINLAFVDLKNANLEQAFLQAGILTQARLQSANFRNADLSQCHLGNSNANQANFDEADLALCDLTGADFEDASLRGASLHKARLSGTRLNRRSLGDAIIQENPHVLQRFLERHYPSLGQLRTSEWVQNRHLDDAQQIYASLKNNFLSIGNFEDASWAHIKQRQIMKMTHHPIDITR
mgnify:CR=1 FL=1